MTMPVGIGRQVGVSIFDEDGAALEGATIHVIIDGREAATIKSSGESSIEIDQAVANLELEVEYGGQVRSFDLSKRGPVSSASATFQRRAFVRGFAGPEARCPDGTSGRPCATCRVGGVEIKVCG